MRRHSKLLALPCYGAAAAASVWAAMVIWGIQL